MSDPQEEGLTANEVIALLARLKGIDPPILVGGQALNVLARHYRIAGFGTPSSTDMDFVGDSEEARQIAALWGATIRIPTMDDNTPNTAILMMSRPGRPPLVIDFLESVAESAFGAEVPSLHITENGVAIRVLHPLSCLQSRLWNIYGPLARRNTREIDRARLAIQVLHTHLTTLLDRQDTRGALKVIERLARRVVLSRVSRRAWMRDQIDVLTAVPINHAALPEAFRTVRWPAIQKQVQEAREKDRQARPQDGSHGFPDEGTGSSPEECDGPEGRRGIPL